MSGYWEVYLTGPRRWRDALMIRSHTEEHQASHMIYIEKHLAIDNNMTIPERPLAQEVMTLPTELMIAEALDYSVEKRMRMVSRGYDEVPELLFVMMLSKYNLGELELRVPAVQYMVGLQMWWVEQDDDL